MDRPTIHDDAQAELRRLGLDETDPLNAIYQRVQNMTKKQQSVVAAAGLDLSKIANLPWAQFLALLRAIHDAWKSGAGGAMAAPGAGPNPAAGLEAFLDEAEKLAAADPADPVP